MKFRNKIAVSTLLILVIFSTISISIIYELIVANSIRSEKKRIQAYAERILENSSINGRIIANLFKIMSTALPLNRARADLVLMANRLRQFRSQSSILYSLFYYDNQGICQVKTSDRIQTERYFPGLIYWDQFRKGETLFLHHIYRDDKLNQDMLLIAYPMFGKNKQFHGYIGGNLLLSTILVQLLPEAMDLYQNEKIGITILDERNRILSTNHRPDLLATVNFKDVPNLHKKEGVWFDKDGRYHYILEQGEKKLENLMPLRIWLSLDQDQLASGAREIRQYLLVIFFLMILVVTTYAYASGFYLSRPLETLIQGISALSHGERPASLPLTTRDEFGSLANAFRKLVDNLRQTEEQRQIALKDLEISRDIIESSAHVVISREPAPPWAIVYFSQNSASIGLQKSEFDQFGDFLSFIFPPDREIYSQQFFKAVEKGEESFQIEYRILSETGDIFWIHESVMVRYDDKRRAIDYYGILTDISARKSIEQSLSQSQNQFRLFAEILDVVIWISDFQQNKIIYVNQTFQTVFGLSCEAVYKDQASFLDVVYPEDRSFVTSELLASQSTGRLDMRYRILRKDDQSLRWISARSFPVYGEEGQILQSIGVAEDITSQKEFEKSLIDARILAEEASLAKTQFLARMSHEIRTPLNAIMGMTELAIGSQSKKEQQEYLASVMDAAQHLLNIIQDILEISRMEANKPNLREENFYLRNLLFSVSQNLEPLAATSL